MYQYNSLLGESIRLRLLGRASFNTIYTKCDGPTMVWRLGLVLYTRTVDLSVP